MTCIVKCVQTNLVLQWKETFELKLSTFFMYICCDKISNARWKKFPRLNEIARWISVLENFLVIHAQSRWITIILLEFLISFGQGRLCQIVIHLVSYYLVFNNVRVNYLQLTSSYKDFFKKPVTFDFSKPVITGGVLSLTKKNTPDSRLNF